MHARSTWLFSIAEIVLLLTGSAVAGAQPPDRPLDAKERTSVIDRIAAELSKGYVYPDTARSMVKAMLDRRQRGDYDRLTTPREFADSLTAHLRAVSHDRHLRILSRAQVENAPRRAAGENPAVANGLEEATILDGNLGYLRLSGFAAVERVGPAITSSMAKLSATDALIIDLRQNGGGSPTSVMFLAGYLFPERTLMARIYSRPDDSTIEMWTANVPGEKYLNKDVFILVSRRTFSAAEAAAYHLQAFARATVVGDTTGGGAHRVSRVDLNQRFAMSLPVTRPINVRTGTDWEGIGVIPDIAVPEDKALPTAHLNALKRLPQTPDRQRTIAALVAVLRARRD